MRQAEAETVEGPQDGGSGRTRSRRRWRVPVLLGVAALALVGGGAAWLARERIARDVIDDYLAARGVPATYDIVSLTPQRQVIENLVIGDSSRPDLTARRMVIETGVGWTGPTLRRVTVEGARVFARFKGGKLSLGRLDPLVFTGSAEPPALPAIDVVLSDARGLIDSDYGRAGFKLEGRGRLDDGFAGVLAATAPGIGTADCRAASATLYGSLTTAGGAPAFDGPLRIADLSCGGATLARADIRHQGQPRARFRRGDGRFPGDRRRRASRRGDRGRAGRERRAWLVRGALRLRARSRADRPCRAARAPGAACGRGRLARRDGRVERAVGGELARRGVSACQGPCREPCRDRARRGGHAGRAAGCPHPHSARHGA
ncbi:MAG: hypothetical protein ACKO1O_00515 [Erythrobacter sp.]